MTGERLPIDGDGDADSPPFLPPNNKAIAMMIINPASTMLPAMIQGPLEDWRCAMDRG